MAFELNTTQATVCKLISAAMFHTKETFAADVDWNAVREEMRAQTVQGLVLDILPELPISEELRKSWRNECLQIMKSGILLRSEQGSFLRILEEAEIPYVVLKGTAAAMYYPNPLLRAMGDVDVYIPDQFHEKVKSLLLNNDYSFKKVEHYKRHVEYFKNDAVFEVHRTFATINGPKEKAYVDGLLETCCSGDPSQAVRVAQGQSAFNVPQTNINGIVLLEHIGQHMIAGLGLRQIIDWMMFVNTALHDNEWEVFQEMARKAGLETLAKTVTKMCIDCLGLYDSYFWCMDADDRTSEEILAYLFDSGNFGRKQVNYGRVSQVENRIRYSGGIISALQAAGESNWKLYKQYHWLKPFAWFYQIFRYTRQILTSPDGVRTLSKGTVEANRRSDLMKSLNIYRK